METANSARRLIPAGRRALILAAWLLGAAAPYLTAQTPAPSAPAPRPDAQQPSGSEPGQYWYDQAQLQQRYGMTDEAEKCYAKAIEAAKTDDEKKEGRQRLELYKLGKPYRETATAR